MITFKLTFILLISIPIVGCATLTGKNRLIGGSAMGGGIGATAGFAFSPNQESRGLNALVFGLAGALTGAVMAVLTDKPPTSVKGNLSLRERDQGLPLEEKNYGVSYNGSLPIFVKDRLRPVVIEEFIQRDNLSDDGTLHEPHKVYRIKRNAELISGPLFNQPSNLAGEGETP